MLWESRCFDCENGIVRHCELLRPLSCILPVLPSLLMRKSNRGECGRRNGFRPESNAGTGTNHAGSQYFLLYWLLYGHTVGKDLPVVCQVLLRFDDPVQKMHPLFSLFQVHSCFPYGFTFSFRTAGLKNLSRAYHWLRDCAIRELRHLPPSVPPYSSPGYYGYSSSSSSLSSSSFSSEPVSCFRINLNRFLQECTMPISNSAISKVDTEEDDEMIETSLLEHLVAFYDYKTLSAAAELTSGLPKCSFPARMDLIINAILAAIFRMVSQPSTSARTSSPLYPCTSFQ